MGNGGAAKYQSSVHHPGFISIQMYILKSAASHIALKFNKPISRFLMSRDSELVGFMWAIAQQVEPKTIGASRARRH
jgi:hypothetical protein